ncbi:Microcompartment protein, bacteria [Moorella glycerini]|uniref:Propanediol utilization protein PduA n=1 Tax=Neomoorella stamsii TaxID=1266720 RepID=A0A9X7J0B8_9FIRM|nr:MULTISPECIES: BMC domain-containing protein [Moorella]PRR68629.1 Propanediol utilization protein PduA [Moorella stamsii]CEP69032.1 Microcompartment protein, bacteria [Moorella glycerini]
MNKQALGIIEVRGLATAVAAADTAAKTAAVTIRGYESTKGSGLVVLKISGEVSAVTAAIEAAKAQVANVSTVFASRIIARPHEELARYLT